MSTSVAPPGLQSATSIIESLQRLRPQTPTNIILLGADVMRDLDDPLLVILLVYLHRLGHIKLILIQTNVKPAQKRAEAAKFIIKKMSAPEIPVGHGTAGTGQNLSYHDWEFDIGGVDDSICDGMSAAVEMLKNLAKDGEKCRMVVTASLRDLSELITKHEDLVKATVSLFCFQGGWEMQTESAELRVLAPDLTATNNNYDQGASRHVHQWLQRGITPTFTATRHSAPAAAVSSSILKDTNGRDPFRNFFYKSWIKQEQKYFADAAMEDPRQRFKEHMDLVWYTRRHKRWIDAKGCSLPANFEEMSPYTDIVLYDVVAGLYCALKGHDFIDQLYQPQRHTIKVDGRDIHHDLIGRSINGNTIPDVNGSLLSNVISCLLQNAFATR